MSALRERVPISVSSVAVFGRRVRLPLGLYRTLLADYENIRETNKVLIKYKTRSVLCGHDRLSAARAFIILCTAADQPDFWTLPRSRTRRFVYNRLRFYFNRAV